MIKKDISVTDLDGNPRIKTYYFSIPPTEMFRMDSEMGGLERAMNQIMREQDVAKIIEVLEQLIRKSVGIRKDDEFYRSEEVTEQFMNSEAFSSLLIEFLTDPKTCAEWCAGILPADLAKKLKASGDLEQLGAPKAKAFPDDYTPEELDAMSKEEFQRLLSTLPGNNIPRSLLLIAMTKR